MNDSPANFLLLEDIATVQFFVRNALSSLTRPYNLLTAGTLAEARKLAEEKLIELFIVDIGLPDGDGIDFLCEMAILQPQATAVIVTASPTDDNRARAEQLGIIQLLSKPINREKLVEAVSKLLGWNTSNFNPAAPSFRATLSGLTPIDIVQLKCMSSSTGILEFTNSSGVGRVYFDKGNVIHSTVRTLSGGSAIGLDAFETIVGWKSGKVSDVQDNSPCPHTIRTGWQSLLLEVAQRQDEHAA
jgi:CheY-like chemotaxis protein